MAVQNATAQVLGVPLDALNFRRVDVIEEGDEVVGDGRRTLLQGTSGRTSPPSLLCSNWIFASVEQVGQYAGQLVGFVLRSLKPSSVPVPEDAFASASESGPASASALVRPLAGTFSLSYLFDVIIPLQTTSYKNPNEFYNALTELYTEATQNGDFLQEYRSAASAVGVDVPDNLTVGDAFLGILEIVFPPDDDENDADDDADKPAWVVALIVISCTAFMVFLILLVCCMRRKKLAESAKYRSAKFSAAVYVATDSDAPGGFESGTNDGHPGSDDRLDSNVAYIIKAKKTGGHHDNNNNYHNNQQQIVDRSVADDVEVGGSIGVTSAPSADAYRQRESHSSHAGPRYQHQQLVMSAGPRYQHQQLVMSAGQEYTATAGVDATGIMSPEKRDSAAVHAAVWSDDDDDDDDDHEDPVAVPSARNMTLDTVVGRLQQHLSQSSASEGGVGGDLEMPLGNAVAVAEELG